MSAIEQPRKLTPEETEVLNKDIKSLNEKLIPILSELQLGIGAEPVILPGGLLGARPVIFRDFKKEDKKDSGETPPPQPTPSPIAADGLTNPVA